MLAKGVHGIFVLGTTGEFYALDEREKQEVIATAVAHCEGPVAGVTPAPAPRRRARSCASRRWPRRKGRTACRSSRRTSSSRRRPRSIDHFRRIAESTTLPVVLYNNPATCGGVKIEPDTVAKLAEVPNIVGIKDSSGDLQNTIEIIRCTPSEKFAC